MMFCPKCRDEFVEGIAECPDCKLPLVDELSVEEGPTYEPIYVDLVTVMESGDSGLIMVAKSLLEMLVSGITPMVKHLRIYLEVAHSVPDLIH